jgi:hypothetical protein
MKLRAAALLTAITWSIGARADDAARMAVTDPRPVMVAAIDAPSGRAHGVLTGGMADAIGRKFKAPMPILIDVTTEKRYAQAGCSRLNVLFRQAGVHLPGAASSHEQTIAFGIDYCRDGSPPRSRQEQR